MDSKIAEQILDELAPTLEQIESQSTAILQFLKEKGIASDEQLAPYLEQASAASSVRWRALRVRMGRLFLMAEKNEDEKRAKQADVEKLAAKATSGAQVADAKQDQPDREPGKASGSEKGAEVGDQDARAVGAESDRDRGIRRHRKESPPVQNAAQNQDTGAASSEGAKPPRADRAKDAGKKKDVA